jgi:hypothetical protein
MATRYTNITTAFILEYAIIGEKLKSTGYEITPKKIDTDANTILRKFNNKLKRYGITSKQYYINSRCIEYDLEKFSVIASIKNEYIALYAPQLTTPASYVISENVIAYTPQHAMLKISRRLYDVVSNKHYEYYSIGVCNE